jgi:hypothetical protein
MDVHEPHSPLRRYSCRCTETTMPCDRTAQIGRLAPVCLLLPRGPHHSTAFCRGRRLVSAGHVRASKALYHITSILLLSGLVPTELIRMCYAFMC